MSRRKNRTRVCTYFKNGRSYRRCTKKPGAVNRCKKYTGARLRSTAAAPGRHIATITNKGWADPVVPAVGRFYASESSATNKGWCSGTLVRRGVVLTAAHCIYANGVDTAPDGSANHYYDHTRMTFVPGNRINPSNSVTGLTSYGNWSIRNMWAINAWAANDQSKDWGLVLLNPDQNGNYPGDTTGTFPRLVRPLADARAEHAGDRVSGELPLRNSGFLLR